MHINESDRDWERRVRSNDDAGANRALTLFWFSLAGLIAFMALITVRWMGGGQWWQIGAAIFGWLSTMVIGGCCMSAGDYDRHIGAK